jgi:uncharacterized protein (TIGR03083 family)
MTTMPVTPVASIPRISHDEAMPIAAREYDAFVDLLRALDDDDWSRPTDNDEWDVRATALHVLGATAANASMREMAHQMFAGRKLYKQIGANRWHHWVDGINEVQIRERATVTNAELVAAFAAVAPKAVAGRKRLPAPVRALRVVDLPAPYTKRQPLGWLTDVCYTRDTWMHRVDITRATGTPMVLTAAHDGRLVADMVAEWATLHTDPFDLELTGPAGGHYRRGDGGEHVTVDAVDYVRVISMRAPGTGVLANSMPL